MKMRFVHINGEVQDITKVFCVYIFKKRQVSGFRDLLLPMNKTFLVNKPSDPPLVVVKSLHWSSKFFARFASLLVSLFATNC